MPFVPSSFLLLVVRPGAPSSVLSPNIGQQTKIVALQTRREIIPSNQHWLVLLCTRNFEASPTSTSIHLFFRFGSEWISSSLAPLRQLHKKPPLRKWSLGGKIRSKTSSQSPHTVQLVTVLFCCLRCVFHMNHQVRDCSRSH